LTRLDRAYVSALVRNLEADPAVRSALRFGPSSTLHRTGPQIGWCTPVEVGGEVVFELHTLEATPEVDAALGASRTGALPRAIAQAVTQAVPGCRLDEAAGMVDELIALGFLVSELEPPVTGPRATEHVIETLRDAEVAHATCATLEKVLAETAKFDADGRADRDAYERLASELESLGAPVDRAKLWHIDLARDLGALTLGSDVTRAIAEAATLQHRLGVRAPPSELIAFRSAFRDRYGDGEVRLTDVLDSEMGLGFGPSGGLPTSLTRNLAPRRRGAPESEVAPARLERLTRAAFRYRDPGGRSWELDDEDVSALCSKEEPLPEVFCVLAQIAAASEEALARGDFRVYPQPAWYGGASLFGRFCHADPRLREHVARLLAEEEAFEPGAIFAEIVHLPNGRVGNIAARPIMRSWEIPYLGRGGAPPGQQITVDDLWVSLWGERLRLRSEKLDRFVVPRMTNAHNAEANLPVYRFLTALQAQDTPLLAQFGWGPLRHAPRLPRVTRGRAVLSLARWRLDSRDIAALTGSAAARFRAVRELRERVGLPRWVTMREGSDLVMPLDLDNVLCVDAFVEKAKSMGGVTLTELFPAPDELAVRGPGGRYASEVLVPFISRRPPKPAPAPPPRPSIRRSFGPGSEWLFIKLYAGPITAEDVLTDVVAPLVRAALSEGDADRWFFLRYADPRPHLRLRLHGDPARLLTRCLPRLHDATDAWITTGKLESVVIGTYEREIERYGGDTVIESAEALFEADSEAVLRIVGLYRDGEARWRLALFGIHHLLDALGLTEAERLVALRSLLRGQYEALGFDGSTEHQVAKNFRETRAELERLLDSSTTDFGELTEGIAALRTRADAVTHTARLLERAHTRIEDRLRVAGSLIHMHANRMLTDDAGIQEAVLCDYLVRVYESRLARRKKAAPLPGR